MIARIAKARHTYVVAMLALASGACVSTPADAHLTERQVIRIADAAVQRHHRELRDFMPRSATFSSRTRTWSVGYQPRRGKADFLMEVDDHTRQVQMLSIDTW